MLSRDGLRVQRRARVRGADAGRRPAAGSRRRVVRRHVRVSRAPGPLQCLPESTLERAEEHDGCYRADGQAAVKFQNASARLMN